MEQGCTLAHTARTITTLSSCAMTYGRSSRIKGRKLSSMNEGGDKEIYERLGRERASSKPLMEGRHSLQLVLLVESLDDGQALLGPCEGLWLHRGTVLLNHAREAVNLFLEVILAFVRILCDERLLLV
jgi:hypothetical protein